MPHLIIQASANVTIKHPQSLLKALNQTLWDSGEFERPEDIKARMSNIDTFLVGIDDGQQQQGFVYLQLRVMPGRSAKVLDALGNELLSTLKANLAPASGAQANVQYCVEVTELSGHYKKSNG